MGDPRKFAAAVAVRKNNQSGGSIPKAKSLVGGASSVGPEPAGDYDEVDALHRALGSAIVDKVMKSREEKLSRGGMVGPQEDEEDDFLDGTDEFADDMYEHSDHSDPNDVDEGSDESEGEDETGEGAGGTRSQGPLLRNIFSRLRARHMGR